jgi:phosphonate transport system substrate-binding protein
MIRKRLNIFKKASGTIHFGRITSFLIFIFTISTFLLGCSSEPEATFVDFSNRMAVAQPGDQFQGSSYFNVAVGSMISAQETAVHYHQFLNYIAAKLDRKIQLIQRKTYGEINDLIGLVIWHLFVQAPMLSVEKDMASKR